MASKVIFTSSPKTPRPSAATILGWLCAAGWPLSASSARWRRRWSRPPCWRDWNTTGAARCARKPTCSATSRRPGGASVDWSRCTPALLVAALASQLLYEALWSYSHWHSHGFVALLFSLPLWLLFLGGLLMLRRLCGELLPLEEPVLHLLGRELDRVAAPGLWQWLGQIADRAGAPLPDHVVTGIEHCYFVTQAKVLLAPRGIPLEGRTLYIPLTYASVMSEAESAAIIGHELGHFAAGDTAHGASLSLLQRQVRLRIERIAAPEDGHVGLLGKPGLWAALYFLDRFERAYLHWNRRQELAADKVGARVAGARVFAIALLRTCALAGLIERLLASPQTRNLVHALTDHLRGNSLELDEHDSARRLEHPFDSHPPTFQRIADLSLALDDDLLRQARRIVSADDTQWLNRLLDAGHGESR
ncbi:M48 family metalloprotease [Pseudomonas aeruginosa]|uniref:M48 family metallopeptidase n=1 Tax=Pseudomonas aeruginosa TaxID=287 RepID=UPI003D030227